MSELQQRVLISAVFIPVLLLALWFEGIAIFGLFAIVCILGSIEYYSMLRNVKITIPWIWVGINTAIYVFMSYQSAYDLPVIWLLVFFALMQALFSWDEQTGFPRVFALVFGTIYLSILPSMIVRIAWYQPVKKILLALILMIWIVDSIAYFIGMRFGKMRGITSVSPKKSLEGFIAGLIAPAVILLILYLSGLYFLPWKIMILIAFAAGCIGQLGDLSESMFKRFCQVKDSSRLIPGHGGVLDRTDSILLAGSFLYAALQLLA